MAPSLRCSIIGTCLSAAELRQFFVKIGEVSAKTASDHTLHSFGVNAAGKHDLIGKLLNKALDNRHEAAIRRFSKASSSAQVRDLWLEAFEQGGIPGGYWAVLTHPATDRPLVEEAFGQVHMLSHMVGSSNRTDIVRLRTLERELGERDEKISRQEARLSESSRERSELLRKVERLEAEVRRQEGNSRADGCRIDYGCVHNVRPSTAAGYGESSFGQIGRAGCGAGRPGQKGKQICRDPE
jgi:hypothetical protein